MFDRKKKYKSILVISDMHQPYAHPDLIAFLREIKEEYEPDKIVCIGDELDYHAMSFHQSNVDLPSAGHELSIAISKMRPIYEMFPDVDLVESNHGSMVLRKALHFGLPSKTIRCYNDVLDAPIGWSWHDDLIITASNDDTIYFCHNKTQDALKNSQALGMSFVQGHFHERAEIRYWGNPEKLMFAMTVGCLIDKKSLAFQYNKTNLKRPVIGCAIILNGHPKLLPMTLDRSGRWTKKLT